MAEQADRLAEAFMQRAQIGRDEVLSSMSTTDLEEMGVLCAVLTDRKFLNRIEPRLSFGDVHPFLMKYYERCLRLDCDGEWADSRYSAAWSGLLNSSWNTLDVRMQQKWKRWLESLYLSADDQLRHDIVVGLLEHLFANPSIRKCFRNWKATPELRDAFQNSLARDR